MAKQGYQQKQKQEQSLKAGQLQALQYLSMNHDQLDSIIQEMANTNPLLEINQDYYQRREYEYEDQFSSTKQTFREDLLLQLHTMQHIDQKACEAIIIALDEDGYFRYGLKRLAQESEISMKRLELALHTIQQLEPCGVGASNLCECLQLQIARMRHPQQKQLWKLCEYLPELAKQDISFLLQKLHCNETKLMELIQIIKNLHPKPCDGTRDAPILYPDIFLELKEDQLIVTIHDVTQYIDIHTEYQYVSDKAVKAYLKAKSKQISELLERVQYRNQTLQKVCGCIFELQKQHFLAREPLKPLLLKDISELLHCHISTISRCIANKAFLFDGKIYLLSSLFVKAVNHVSPQRIIQHIKTIIQQETNILTDVEITRRLEILNIHISRRTVTKYRKELVIPNAASRKHYKSYDRC